LAYFVELQIRNGNNIIYDELCCCVVNAKSKQIYRDIITSMISEGAQGIIMGCTEITMLIDEIDSAVPLFDTTKIHVEESLKQIFH